MADVPEAETFTERFNRLTKGLKDAELMTILGLSLSPLNKIRNGDTQTLKLHAGLRLAKRLGVSPAYLAFGVEDVSFSPGFDSERQELTATVLDLKAKLEDLSALVHGSTMTRSSAARVAAERPRRRTDS